jgi:hypothetical protein
MYRMSPTKSAILAEFQLVRRCTFIFGRRIVSSFAFITCKCNNYSHQKTPSAVTR